MTDDRSTAARGPDRQTRDDRAPGQFPPLKEILARHRLSPRRALGQNFLLDPAIARKIAHAAGDLTDATVLEIGPGPGGLTRALLMAGAKRVLAIEKDARCLPALTELVDAAQGRLQLIEADALEIDEARLARGRLKVVANLPYNIATPLLIKWLKTIDRFDDLTLMFQKEVALRITAVPGNRIYGRLSVMCQWLCEAKRLFDLKPNAFVPPPKVTSTLVKLTPRPAPLYPTDWDSLERVTAAAFGQRRKMLRSALKTLFTDPGPILERAGLPGSARAESLSVGEFGRLADAYRAAQAD